MRRATISAAVDEAATIAAAIEPDDTDEIDTHVEDGTLVVTIERASTSGLRSTLDDYLVNLDVAVQVADQSAVERAPDIESAIDGKTDTDTGTNTDPQTRTNINTNTNTNTDSQ